MAATDDLVTEGNRREDAGDLHGACELYREAIRLAPSSPRGHLNLGIALAALGQIEAAASAYRAVLTIDPAHPFGNYNYAVLAYGSGDWSLAEKLAKAALAARPDFVLARILLSNAMTERGDSAGALSELDEVLRLEPDHAGAHFNRAIVLKQLERLDEAGPAAERAFQLDPRNVEAAAMAASLLHAQGFVLESLPWLREARRLAPDRLDLRSRELFASNVDETVEPDAQFEAHRAFGELLQSQVRPVYAGVHRGDRDPHRRLRVGFVSADFWVHPVALFLLPLLGSRDRSAIDIVCYSSTGRPDHITDSIRAQVDAWVDAAGWTDAQLAARIHADSIDVLVDLGGHTSAQRLAVFAAMPAPVQATWLGYLNTTGLTRIGYRVCDARTDPPETAPRFTEALAYLESSQWCYRPFIDVPAAGEAPFERNGYVTFGSFNQGGKITSAMAGRWGLLLQRVPNSRLVIADVAAPAKREAIVAAMGAQLADRIEFVERLDLPNYFRLFDRVDVALDTYPYGGGTTTFDALWMGVPVVTAPGRLPGSRSAASILSPLGLEDWIAPSIEGYVDVAVSRAQERRQLGELRLSLRRRLKASPLTDESRFASHFEAALRRMWQRYCLTAPAST